MRVRPRGKSGHRPPVVVAAMAAYISHGIDGGRTADHLAAGAFEAAPAYGGLGFREIHPVVLAVEKQTWPAERDVNAGIAIPAASFENVSILGQPARQCATGRTGADDDDVVNHTGSHGRINSTRSWPSSSQPNFFLGAPGELGARRIAGRNLPRLRAQE